MMRNFILSLCFLLSSTSSVFAVHMDSLQQDPLVVRAVPIAKHTSKDSTRVYKNKKQEKILELNLLRFLETDSVLLSPEAERILDLIEGMEARLDSIQYLTDTIIANPLFLPLVFKGYPLSKNTNAIRALLQVKPTLPPYSLERYDDWLMRSLRTDSLRQVAEFNVYNKYPHLITYIAADLPEAPVPIEMKVNPRKNILQLEDMSGLIKTGTLNKGLPKIPLWVSKFQSSIQFSQVYISDNWYQGGESNLNIVSSQLYNLNFDNRKNLIFNNEIQWKTGINNAPNDTVHSLRVNEDLFQLKTQYGLKAFKHWYYSVSGIFKTQFYNSYESNSNKLLTKFLCPGEVNLSVGMNYQYENKKRRFTGGSLSLNPLSYNLKFVTDNKNIDPTRFGIEKDKKSLSQIGSSVEGSFTWEFFKNIIWRSRIFYFTNYEKVQVDFENTLDFNVNRFFSTRLFVHVRYDDSAPKKESNTLFQYKELLSFGFNYRF